MAYRCIAIEMNMDIKKTLLWVVFSVSGLMLFNSWQIQNGKPPLFGGPAPTAATQPAAKPADGGVPTPVASPSNAVAVQDKTPANNDSKVVTKTVHLKNDLVDLEVDARGGNLIKATLLKQFDKGEPVVIFKTDGTQKYQARSGLVANGLDLPNHNDVFNIQSTGPLSLVLTAEKSGVLVEKTYTLDKDGYILNVKNKVTNKTSQVISPSIYEELIRDGAKIDESQFYSTFTGPAIYTDKEKFHKVDFADIEKNKVSIATEIPGTDNAWVSMVQHYFASAWFPENLNNREFYFGKIDNNLYRAGIKTALGEIAPSASKTESARLFVGPQEEKMLESLAPGFELVKDYGWLTIIAKPIFWLLTQIHAVIGNWGWAIVILTIFIKLLFFPLSAASYKSMARMKEVQPRLLQMKEQYKNEPQKLNKAMMEMYRKEKINPLGGCLPVVVQIPVFISLYWVLLATVEMRNAPWILWIHDLSAPDRFFSDLIGLSIPIGILPIVMAISMYIQTKLNPTPPDPIQAKVMQIMPLVFSVMFFAFPSGLVLYWVVNNILSIAQQWQINKMFGAKKA